MTINEIGKPIEKHLDEFNKYFKGLMNSDVPLLNLIIKYITKKKGKQVQLSFDTEWTQDRVQENEQINKIRSRVSLWNYNLGFTIPYTINGEEKGYYPDFIVKLSDRHTVIAETKGQEDLDVPLKMARLRQWCEDINQSQQATVFDYVFVDEESFAKYMPKAFKDLMDGFRGYKDKT